MSQLLSQIMWFQKISKPLPRMVICFVPSPPASGIYSLASYYPLKIWLLRPPTPSEFLMTILSVGIDIFL